MQVCSLLVGPKAGRHTVTVDYAQLRNTLLNELQTQFPSVDLLRVYWYDGPGPNGSKTQSHTHIEDLDDFKLRLGVGFHKGQQTHVAGLIAGELTTLASRHALADAILMSGDADLRDDDGPVVLLGHRYADRLPLKAARYAAAALFAALALWVALRGLGS